MQPETSSLQPLSSTITTNLGPQGDKEMALHQDHLDFQSKQHLEAVSGENFVELRRMKKPMTKPSFFDENSLTQNAILTKVHCGVRQDNW
ncbi:hypothetical protein J6590_097605 [Homalodisca vitripennis]|nr:hypothetical protein J6590_097605 [Homalodisca vitripennis]